MEVKKGCIYFKVVGHNVGEVDKVTQGSKAHEA